MKRFEKGQRVAFDYRATKGTVHLADDLVVLIRWDSDAFEVVVDQDDLNRLEVLPTFDERWINVYAPGTGNSGWTSRAEADHGASADGTRIGVIHLATDGSLTMEAP